MQIKRRNYLKLLGLSFLTASSVIISSTSSFAEPQYYTGIIRGVAVGGYDPVAYFSKGKPAKGSANISTEWDGVKWRFSSKENMELFLANPKKYAPQYGGYCSWAVANNTLAKGNPLNWKVVNGKLYLNVNRSIHKTWEKKQSNFISEGNKNWPNILN